MYQNNIFRYQNRQGFTLVELMIVIAIIGILSVALYPAMGQYFERSKMATVYATINELKKMAELYQIDHNGYPTVACESRLPIGDLGNCDVTNDPFVPYGGIYTKVTPWGGEIVYGSANIWGGPGLDSYFLLNDDSRYVVNDDAHKISELVLGQIDKKIDDGDLGTGSFMGNSATGSFTGSGEGVLILEIQ